MSGVVEFYSKDGEVTVAEFVQGLKDSVGLDSDLKIVVNAAKFYVSVKPYFEIDNGMLILSNFSED